MYSIAVNDMRTRIVLNRSISNSMVAELRKNVVQEAVNHYGQLDVINTDQGSRYPSDALTSYVLHQDRNIK